jgi:hypothetical protein
VFSLSNSGAARITEVTGVKMLKALVFKEWLKIRWAALIMLAIFLLAIIKIVLDVSYNIRMYQAHNYWYDLTVRGVLFYHSFYYLPLLAGLLIGATQFFAEISSNRLKLMLHLPVRENALLIFMTAFGIAALTSIFLSGFILLSLITIWFFPFEVLWSVWLTSLPWFLAGYAGYLSLTQVFIEPLWTKRIFYLLIAYGFINLLLEQGGYNLYQHSWPWFILLTMLYSISIVYSGNRFRKGVM